MLRLSQGSDAHQVLPLARTEGVAPLPAGYTCTNEFCPYCVTGRRFVLKRPPLSKRFLHSLSQKGYMKQHKHSHLRVRLPNRDVSLEIST